MSKWDLYNDKFEKTGTIINNADMIKNGYYHYTINIWIFNRNDEVLLLRNCLNDSLFYPGFWSCLNENVLSGETAKTCCKRVMKEIFSLLPNDYQYETLGAKTRDPHHYIYETIIITLDNQIQLTLNNNQKYMDKKWVDKVELQNMITNGEISQFLVPRINEYIYKKM